MSRLIQAATIGNGCIYYNTEVIVCVLGTLSWECNTVVIVLSKLENNSAKKEGLAGLYHAYFFHNLIE